MFVQTNSIIMNRKGLYRHQKPDQQAVEKARCVLDLSSYREDEEHDSLEVGGMDRRSCNYMTRGKQNSDNNARNGPTKGAKYPSKVIEKLMMEDSSSEDEAAAADVDYNDMDGQEELNASDEDNILIQDSLTSRNQLYGDYDDDNLWIGTTKSKFDQVPKVREYPDEQIQKKIIKSYYAKVEARQPAKESNRGDKKISNNNYNNRENPPPLANNPREKLRGLSPPPLARSSHQNAENPIKYTCYKIVNNQQLIQHAPPPQHNNYNTLNLDISEIPADHSHQLKEELKETRQMLESTKSEVKYYKNELEQTKRAFEQKNALFKEVNDKLCETREELLEAKQQLEKCQGQLSRSTRKYTPQTLNQNSYNTITKQVYASTSQHQSTKAQPTQEQTYKQITVYLTTVVKNVKQQLQQHRMSLHVQSILQDFMEQLLNINSVTVNRGNKNVTPDHNNRNKSPINSRLFSSTQQETRDHHTPVRSLVQKEKSQQLRNLQKSLHKLKEMQNSFIMDKSSHQHSSSNFCSNSSLDRSSIMHRAADNDLSRSKSRRKKIFG